MVKGPRGITMKTVTFTDKEGNQYLAELLGVYQKRTVMIKLMNGETEIMPIMDLDIKSIDEILGRDHEA